MRKSEQDVEKSLQIRSNVLNDRRGRDICAHKIKHLLLTIVRQSDSEFVALTQKQSL